MAKEIPNEVKGVLVDEMEKLLFPYPAKTIGGAIARILFKIVKVLVPSTKINI